MKSPLTLTGIEPAAFRFVAQHLKHCATAVSIYCEYANKISMCRLLFKGKGKVIPLQARCGPEGG